MHWCSSLPVSPVKLEVFCGRQPYALAIFVAKMVVAPNLVSAVGAVLRMVLCHVNNVSLEVHALGRAKSAGSPRRPVVCVDSHKVISQIQLRVKKSLA